MHESGSQTRPRSEPDEIEWLFAEGQPAIVVHIPDGEGNYAAYRLDQTAPEGHYEREHVRALLRIAERVMADTEPTFLSGLKSAAAVTR